jgi:hypothetical protein
MYYEFIYRNMTNTPERGPMDGARHWHLTLLPLCLLFYSPPTPSSPTYVAHCKMFTVGHRKKSCGRRWQWPSWDLNQAFPRCKEHYCYLTLFGSSLSSHLFSLEFYFTFSCSSLSHSSWSLFKLQLQIREEWELEQKRQKEAEEEEKRKEAEKLKKQVCCPFMYVFIHIIWFH